MAPWQTGPNDYSGPSRASIIDVLVIPWRMHHLMRWTVSLKLTVLNLPPVMDIFDPQFHVYKHSRSHTQNTHVHNDYIHTWITAKYCITWHIHNHMIHVCILELAYMCACLLLFIILTVAKPKQTDPSSPCFTHPHYNKYLITCVNIYCVMKFGWGRTLVVLLYLMRTIALLFFTQSQFCLSVSQIAIHRRSCKI